MDNKVGAKIPTAKQIEKAIALIKEAHAILEPCLIHLSADEAKRLVRFRPGGGMVVEKVGKLATERGVSLPGISVEDMEKDLELAKTLAPIAQELEGFLAPVQDTVLEAQAECWWAATAFYSALARTQGADRKLETELKPIVEFFATGRRKRNNPGGEGPK